MELITTHTNADFDTLSSMVAAKKLYPGARVAFPGSLEKGLREALKDLTLPFELSRAKDIELGEVTLLILVDISRGSRLGRFAELVDKVDVKVHVYDHHPGAAGESRTTDYVKADLECIKGYGSTTTILTLLIKERGIELTANEATLMMAGIYEDTGSLGFTSTTEEDYEAAAFLLRSGADLTRVTELLKKELTADEVSALKELIDSETTYNVGGSVVVLATAFTDGYHGDISTLAHRLVEIEGMGSLFLMADMGDRVHVVARSSRAEVNAGEVARRLGGGGHAHAASATIKGITLIQARERVLEALKEAVVPKKTARDVMTAPAITIPEETTLKEASALLGRYNINAAPVLSGGRLSGVITRQVTDKATFHALGSEPVRPYMTTEVEAVSPGASVDEIREKVTVRGQRLLPVIEGSEVIGVVTRTDLLKLLRDELKEAEAPESVERRAGEGRGKRQLKSLMSQSLPEWALKLLKKAGEVAEAEGAKAYAVGGFVRDLVMRRENLDIDIVVEGDGIAFASKLAETLNARVRPHERFLSAVVVFPDGFKLDVATARLEYYERPGALPTVELSSLKLDLFRRDFTINTLAVVLNPPAFGELLDFFDARRDIKEKSIRTLHNLSFVEDPTRALRAVRFEVRFGFTIDKHTLYLIKNTVKRETLDSASGKRLRDELRNILDEERSAEALQRLNELGLLSLIHEGLVWDDRDTGAGVEALFERAREALGWYHLIYRAEKAERWLVLYLTLTERLSAEELKTLTERLSIGGKKRLSVITCREEARRALKLIASGDAARKSERYRLLQPFPIETLLYLMALSTDEGVKRALSDFISNLRGIKPLLNGERLKALGVEEGPVMGSLLRELLDKRLDGELKTSEEEVEFVKGRLKKK